MQCPGSLALSKGIPDTGSSYASEGTAAHFLAQTCLETGVPAADFIEQGIAVSDTGECTWCDGIDGIEITDEIAENVQVYVDTVLQRAEPQFYEVKVDLSAALQSPDQFGTADAVVLDIEEAALEVHDLKFGRGVQVSAHKNEQLMLYAAGAALEYESLGDWQTFRVFIHQPRLNHVDSYEFDRAELVEFIREARKAGARALELLDGEVKLTDLNPTEKACQWCPAKGACPALTAKVHDEVLQDFADDTPPDEAAKLLSEDALSEALALAPLVETWLKATRAEALRRALEGATLPRFKLVAGRAGPRKWTNEDEAAERLKRSRLKKDEMYDFKLISPTKAEKLLAKDKPRVWNKLTGLISQSEGGLSLAPEDDPRPAQKAPTALAEDFDLVGDDAG
jgi:hypothetical protein